jgi:hypothetical protein
MTSQVLSELMEELDHALHSSKDDYLPIVSKFFLGG